MAKTVTVNLEDLELVLDDYESCPWSEIPWKHVEPSFNRIITAMNVARESNG